MVRPVELQDALAKTPAIEKIAQAQKANPDNEQRQNAIAAENKNKEHVHQATEPPKSDEVILHREENKEDQKGKNQQHRDEADKDKPADDQDADGPVDPPSLDITA
jgi:hypothetical protein